MAEFAIDLTNYRQLQLADGFNYLCDGYVNISREVQVVQLKLQSSIKVLVLICG